MQRDTSKHFQFRPVGVACTPKWLYFHDYSKPSENFKESGTELFLV